MREDECNTLAQMFKAKFGKYPDIRFLDTNSHGQQFCIYKTNISTYGVIPFYKMGSDLKTARWYISNLTHLPSALITFESINAKNLWAKNEKLRIYQEEMNRVCLETTERENM